ncbi:MAG TPA: PTS galactitol transporter subunit IIC [Tepidimicrobium sp.]|nr:PTS galactitol transporter subunit IIC [Tepidimicrobium sp.]
MTSVLNVFQYILDLGSNVMLPIVIFILGLLVREKPGRALKSGILVGAGFTMISLLLGNFIDALTPAANAMVERTGIQLSIVDAGWGVAATVAFASRFGLLVIPLCFAINLIMLALRWTKTFNVDIWNFWYIAFVGAIVEFVTGQFWIAVVACIILYALCLVGADLTQKRLEEYTGIPGVSYTTAPILGQMIFAKVMNKILDTLFPRLKNVKLSHDDLQKRFGVFGEPVLIGAVMGLLLGFLAGHELSDTLQLAMTTAATLHVFPRIINVLMEGLVPLSEAAKKYFNERFQGREIYIGIDWIALLQPIHMTFNILLIPIALLLAFILPGNKVLPLGELGGLFAFVFVITPFTKDDIIRTLIMGTILLAMSFYVTGWMAPAITNTAVQAGFQLPEGAVQITSLFKGCNLSTGALFGIAQAIKKFIIGG